MKKIENYTFNQFDKTITLTKKFSKAASIMGTAEFKELMGLMEKYPSYTLKVREIQKPEKKETYKGLTAKRMREFISWQYQENAETLKIKIDEFDTLEKFYDDFHKTEKHSASIDDMLREFSNHGYNVEYSKRNRKDAFIIRKQ